MRPVDPYVFIRCGIYIRKERELIRHPEELSFQYVWNTRYSFLM